MVILAPGMAAPEASVTAPVIAPRSSWAKQGKEKRTADAARKIVLADVMFSLPRKPNSKLATPLVCADGKAKCRAETDPNLKNTRSAMSPSGEIHWTLVAD